MYLSTTQVLKRLGIARNYENAQYIREFFTDDWINISNTNRIPVELYDTHSDWLLKTYNAKEWHPRAFYECQSNPIENQDKRILDLESEIALLKFRLEKAESAISNIIEIFYNINKLKGE